jgi:hypothetical protein
MIRFLSNGVERLYNPFATPKGLPLRTEGLTINLPVQIRMRNIRASFVLPLLFWGASPRLQWRWRNPRARSRQRAT